MNDLSVVYLGNYQVKEEAAFDAEGFRTVRFPEGLDTPVSKMILALNGGRILVRSGRLSGTEYEAFWNSVRSVGARPITSPESLSIISSFRSYYPAIEKFSPKAIVADATISDGRLIDLIRHAGLMPPLFVRTEVESAAKYVGTEACIMKSIDLGSAQDMVRPIRENIKGFREIIVKEVWPIATRNGKRFEYRAIGARSQLVAFDIAPTSPIPPPSAEVMRVTESALRSLSNCGVTGAIFLDMALAQNGTAMVVECKDYSHGTIGNVKAVSTGWDEWARSVKT